MGRTNKAVFVALILFTSVSVWAGDKQNPSSVIPKNAKVFVAPSQDGYDTFLKAALLKKKVPVEMVETREQADFEITAVANSQKASTAKKVLFLDWRSTEEASIRLTNLKTSEVAFSYSVHKQSSAHGKQSSAEACAKHLKEKIESN